MCMVSPPPVKLGLFGAGTRGELDLGYFVDKLRKHVCYAAVAEPDDARREHFARRFHVPREHVFRDWRDLLAAHPPVDAIVNALPCHLHHDSTIGALAAGYHVLLEKPIAHTPGECVHLVEAARQYDQVLAVSFENRYNRIYQKLKAYLDVGALGRLMTVAVVEDIGYWHFILSYVRGIHASAARGNSFMIAKGIHDVDLVQWFVGAPATKVSSFGALSFFREENAPPGAPARCTDGCPVQAECEFDAVKQYVDPGHMEVPFSLLKGQSLRSFLDIVRYPRFRTLASTIVRDVSKANVTRALREGPHGKCVFHSDNGVVDHQTTSIEFGNGVTCAFSLSAFSLVWERTCNLTGTRGEIRSQDWSGRLEVRQFNPARVKKHRIRYHGLHHGGGDEGLLLEFADAVRHGDPTRVSTRADQCLESHLLALAAEEARLTGRVVDMVQFRRKAREAARELARRAPAT